MHVELGNYMHLTRAEWERKNGEGEGGGELAENETGILSISAGERRVRECSVLMGILATWIWGMYQGKTKGSFNFESKSGILDMETNMLRKSNWKTF